MILRCRLRFIIERLHRVTLSDKHSPEKGVGPVVVDFALGVPPVDALPGRLLHHGRSGARTARLGRDVVDRLGGGPGCGALAGGVDRGQAASLRLRRRHWLDPPAILLLRLLLGALNGYRAPFVLVGCITWPGSRVNSSACQPPPQVTISASCGNQKGHLKNNN